MVCIGAASEIDMENAFLLHASALSFWFDSAQAHTDALTTIALRLPILATSRDFGPTGEAQLMIAEKVAAVSQGLAAAGAAVVAAVSARWRPVPSARWAWPRGRSKSRERPPGPVTIRCATTRPA